MKLNKASYMVVFSAAISKDVGEGNSSVSEIVACTTTVKYGDEDEEHCSNLIAARD